ncbi:MULTISPECIES: carbohydrate ABC transporter permease [unclassified Acutalibacter]|jgi:putative aldouronate transport system permease protein|uniref:carbohydrate ABC transporter permease n=1 Tax=unclassified Acutalibacter TaxID=2620728 RepID=UPI0013725EB9|nr:MULTISPECIES: carbohydrate ABC transporter permease [unclassified Acutalibacter]MCI9225468.1 carbohydrate ABC transporter permease [Acutalibacter sp.]NBJ90082.1 carbohydrate ABC transporter permease [Acutalibacter sp. 1XD8-36]
MAMVRNRSVGSKIFNGVNVVFFALVIVVCILPVWHVICASFSDAGWVMNQTGLIWRIKDFNINGYLLVFHDNRIWTGYLNTLLYVFGTTALGMFLTVMAAYALSRKDFLWASPIMFLISFTMLFSGGIVPLYILVTQDLHMFDSRWALILPHCMSAFYLILVRTAMQNVPESLEESAMLDGAGRFTILFQIMLPLIKATLATVILYYIIGNWNSWFSAMIYLRSKDKFPLQLVLKEILVTTSNSNTNVDISVLGSGDSADAILYKQLVKYCTIIVSTVPMFIFYPFVQKYFESGVMIGAIKG